MASPAEVSADCLVIGAGFSGCYSMYKMRQQGYSVKMIEAGTDFGGVWHFNKYPGALVDSEMPLYQLTMPEAWGGFNFEKKFPSHTAMRGYFGHLAEALDLRKDAIFGHCVVEAAYHKASGRWHVTSDKGLRATARYVFFATGTTNKPYAPPFRGIDAFRGRVVHSRAWPDDLRLGNKKRIALIGQGSTGTQIAQEIAKLDAKVTVFVRTPSIGYPLCQGDVALHESEARKGEYEAFFEEAKREGWNSFTIKEPLGSFYEHTPEQRRETWETLWRMGSFNVIVGNYPELFVDEDANAAFYEFWKEKTRARISDPAKQEILAPTKQPIWFMAKRPVFETDYFEMMDRDNVKLVDLKKSEIKEFVSNGIVTTDENKTDTLHEFDLVILATGYDSVTGSLNEMNIRDKNGVLLQDKWRDGLWTHMGLMVPGMPNAFIPYGPQSPGSFSTGPTFIEMQIDLVSGLMEKARAEGRESIEVTDAAAASWREKIYAAYEVMLARHGDSWWVGANIPGKRREPLLWFGDLPSYRDAVEEAMKSWDDFVPSKAGSKL